MEVEEKDNISSIKKGIKKLDENTTEVHIEKQGHGHLKGRKVASCQATFIK